MENSLKNNQSKITPLFRGISDFFERATIFCDNGEYLKALDVLFTAKNQIEPYSFDDIECMIEIAECYSDMGLLHESNKILFECLGHVPMIDDIYFGLINNFAFLEQIDKMKYYISLGKYLGVFDDEYAMAIDVIEGIHSKPNLKLVKNHSGQHLLKLAQQMLECPEMLDYAHQIFQSLLEEDSMCVEAHSGLAFLKFSEGKIGEGIAHCDTALQIDPNNINALTQKCAAYILMNQSDKADEILQQLKDMDANDAAYHFKLLICATSMGNNEFVHKFAKSLLKRLPYDRELLSLYSIACFNLGEEENAKEAALMRSRVYQDEFEGKYFSKMLREHIASGEKIPLSTAVSDEVADELTKSLYDAMKSTPPERFVKKLANDSFLREALKWLIRNYPYASIDMLKHLSKTELGFGYVNYALTNTSMSLHTKQQIFMNACLYEKFEQIRIVINDLALNFHPSIPKVTNKKEFINAYFKAYSAMAFVTVNFDRKMNAAYKKLVKAFFEEGAELFKDSKPKENILAAILAHKANQCIVFSKPSYCCEVFRCKEKEFMQYLNHFDEYFKEERKNKKRTTTTD